MARRKRKSSGGDAVAGFASGFNEGLTSVIRAKYYAALAAKAEGAAKPNDPFAGYGPKAEQSSFFGKLFGTDKPAESAVPTDFMTKAKEAYKAARDREDIPAAETILKNMKRYGELPDPNAKAAPKAAAKPPVEKPAEASKGPGYNLPVPDSWKRPEALPAAKPLPQAIEFKQEETVNKPAILQDAALKGDESAIPVEKKEEETKLTPVNLTVTEDDEDNEVKQLEVAEGGFIGDDTEEEPEAALPMTPPAQPPVAREPVAPLVTTDSTDDNLEDRVTSEMSQAAMPGYAAALRRVSASISSGEGGIGPNPAAASYARGEGAASHEDVTVLNKMVDPDGKLPESARSAARIAAVWDYYGDKDPDRAAELAQSLLLYDRKNSQTRGVMAMQALRDGDTKSAAKLIADAIHKDTPDNARIIPAVMQDGSVAAKVMRDGKVVGEENLTPDQFKAVVQQVASGKAYDSSAMDLVSRWEQNKKDSRGGGNKMEIDNDIRRGLLVTRRAYAQALADQPGEGASEEERKSWQGYFNQIKSAVQTQEERAQEYALTQKDPDKYLKALNIGSVPTTAVTPKGMGAAGRKAEAEQPDEIETLKRRIQNADTFERYGVEVDENGKPRNTMIKRDMDYKATPEEREAARITIEPIRRQLQAELAAKSYEAAPTVGDKTGKYEDREGSLKTSLNEYLTDRNGNKKEPIKLEPQEARRRMRLADRIMKKNDVNAYDVFEFMDKLEKEGGQAMSIDPRSGKVVFGDMQLYVDRQTLGELAKARGKVMAETKAKEETAKTKAAADTDKAIESDLLSTARKGREAEERYYGGAQARANALSAGAIGDLRGIEQYAPGRAAPARKVDKASPIRDELATIEAQIQGIRTYMPPGQANTFSATLDRLESQANALRDRLKRVGSPAPTPQEGAIPMQDREQLNRDFPVKRLSPTSGVMIP
jgi:hypothetical protein